VQIIQTDLPKIQKYLQNDLEIHDTGFLLDTNLYYVSISLYNDYENITQTFPIPCALTEHNAMKAYWGSGSTAPLIF
jgi:hypothetical protein